MKKLLTKWYVNLAAALAALALAYGFASWAIDTAKTVAYLLTVVFLIVSIKYLRASFRIVLKK